MKKKEEINCKIINASIIEFISKGFEAASMENISKLAEVSKRTLYKYHPCKDVLLDELITKLLDECSEKLQFKYDQDLSLEEQLDQIIDAKIDLLTSKEYIQMSKIVIGELLKSKKLSKNQLERFNEYERIFIEWIEQATKSGQIKSDLPPDVIANQFQSIIKGQLFYPVILGISKIDKKLIKQAKVTTKDFFLTNFCR
jgi:TetR/AcrR family transcriptional regulator of autoinduction and epiphytic fitness